MSNTTNKPRDLSTYGKRRVAANEIMGQLRRGSREAILNLALSQGVALEVQDYHTLHRLKKDSVRVGNLTVSNAVLVEPRPSGFRALAPKDPNDFKLSLYLHRSGDLEPTNSRLESDPRVFSLTEAAMAANGLTRIISMTVFAKCLRDAAADLPARMTAENGIPYDDIAALVHAEGPQAWSEALQTATEHRYPVPEELTSRVEAAFAAPAA